MFLEAALATGGRLAHRAEQARRPLAARLGAEVGQDFVEVGAAQLETVTHAHIMAIRIANGYPCR